MHIKQHEIKLGHKVTRKEIERLIEFLQIDPDAEVHLSQSGKEIRIRYNLRRHTFKQVLRALTTAGIPPEPSFLQRLKFAKWSFTEENERDNLGAPSAPCCSNPEQILSQAKKEKNCCQPTIPT